MRNAAVWLVIVGALTWAFGTGRIQQVAAGPEQPEENSPEARLIRIEQKLDELIDDVGDISGRTSIADFLEREIRDIQQEQHNIESAIQRMENSVRRLSSRF